MRKFKLFSYLLIAGMLFSNANMYAMDEQNQNLWDEENHLQVEEIVGAPDKIVNPFYDCVFKILFSPQSDDQKQRLASFVNELFPGAILNYRSIQSLVQEVNFPLNCSSRGKRTVDIPFLVKEGEKEVMYDIEMQQADEGDIEFRLKEYKTALQHNNKKYDTTKLIALLGPDFQHESEPHIGNAVYDIATGNFKKKLEDGTDTFLLKTDYYSSQDSKIDGREGSYFNGTRLPDDGWMVFFDDCSRFIVEKQRARAKKKQKGRKTSTAVHRINISSTYNNYQEMVKSGIRRLNVRYRWIVNLLAELENEDRALENEQLTLIRTERKKNIVSDLADEKNPKRFKSRKRKLLKRTLYRCDAEIQGFISEQKFEYYKENNFDFEQIAKKLKLSAQKEQESESKQDESKSLPTSTK